MVEVKAFKDANGISFDLVITTGEDYGFEVREQFLTESEVRHYLRDYTSLAIETRDLLVREAKRTAK